MLFLFVCAHGQTTPPVSFDYDADGNMTARHVVRSLSSMTKSATSDRDDGKETQAEEEQIFFSVMNGEQKISIYPNPTSGNIFLDITLLDTKQRNFIRLYDAVGRLLLTEQINQNLTPVVIRGPAGIYLLDIHLGNNVMKWKIIKE